MNEPSTTLAWHDAAQEFLRDLMVVQEEFLAVLLKRRQRFVAPISDDWPTVTPVEQSLLQRLQQCHQRRQDLLRAAGPVVPPGQTLRGAVAVLADAGARRPLDALLDEAESASRRLRLAGLTHWMLAQRSLAHVSQLLEILATGTPQPPTYGNGPVSAVRGGLLDEAA